MILHAVMRPTPPLCPPLSPAQSPRLSEGEARPDSGLTPLDVYRLPETDLTDVRGIVFAGDVDQEFLLEHRTVLDAFVHGGGRVLVNGHVQRRFLEGLHLWRKLTFSTPEDLALTRVSEHPVWAGTDPHAFLFSTGEPGKHTQARLREIGVAGFYGRGYLSRLPAAATVIHTLGTVAAPIDVEYPLGAGRVLVHCGNDLQSFMSEDRGTAHMRQQLATWLEGHR